MALEYLDQLAQEAGADSSLQRELALAYQKVGDVQGNPTNANLGDTAGAVESYRKALVIAEALVVTHPTDSQARRSLALIYEKTSDLQAWTGNVRGAVESGRRALTLFQTLAEADPTNLRARQSVAISHIKLGDILGNPNFPNIGDRAEALGHYRQSLTIWQAVAASDPTDATTRRYLGVIHERIGTMQQSEENLAEALESYRQSLEIRESFSATHPTNTDARRDLAIGYEKIADVLMLTGDAKNALEHQRQALAMFEALSAADPNNANASRSLAIGCEKVGDALLELGEATEGLRFYRRSLAIREALSTTDPTNVHLRRGLAGLYAKLGDITTRLAPKPTTAAAQRKERWREVRAWYQRSLDIWVTLRRRGLLKETDASELDRITKEIANCDAALAKLK
jgi:non-specific serine/threonine protein kinase/serine/threonine-protein kinase